MRKLIGFVVALVVVGCGTTQEGDVSIYYESSEGTGGAATVVEPVATGGALAVESSGGSLPDDATGGAAMGGSVETGGSSSGGDPNGGGSESSEGTESGGSQNTVHICEGCFDYCIDGECVECLSDSDCQDGDVCNDTLGACTECESDNNCQDPELPACSDSGFCYACNPGETRDCMSDVVCVGVQECHPNGGGWTGDCVSENGAICYPVGQNGCAGNTDPPGERCPDGSCVWPSGGC